MRDVFVLGAFALTDGRDQVIEMRADGRLIMPGERPSPSFAADGEITMDGNVVATMSSDGTRTSADGQMIAVISEDGAATIGENTFSFDSDGALTGAQPGAPAMTLAPADTPSKRLAMTALVMLLTASRVSTEGPVPTEGPVADD